MGVFKIEGGHTLQGEITPQGAKNEALQVLCAVLLTDQKVTIHNLPDIQDVSKLISLLGNLGVKIQRIGRGSYSFQADEINLDYLKSEAFYREGQALRGSILVVGPLLTRFGVGYIPKPGGDKIGRRRHFRGSQAVELAEEKRSSGGRSTCRTERRSFAAARNPRLPEQKITV